LALPLMMALVAAVVATRRPAPPAVAIKRATPARAAARAAAASAAPVEVRPAVVRPTTTMPAVPPGVIDHGPRDRPAVALTFDSNMTDAMLAELDEGRVSSFDNVAVIDRLDALGVPATFFLSGKWVERYPETTARLAADPLFELASHSYAHGAFHTPCYGLRQMPESEMAADVARSLEVLRQFTDRLTSYFRFPGDCHDAAALAAIEPTGVTVIGAEVASGDAFGRSVTTIVHNVLSEAQNGSIVVLHITGGNTAPLTADALPAIVAGLRARGYALVRVSTLLSGGTS
jgi:peptidoglycan/xylan/chitin deacetylase (PgdA/CDA1 family)